MNTKIYIIGAVLIFTIAMVSAVHLLYMKNKADKALAWWVMDIHNRVWKLEQEAIK